MPSVNVYFNTRDWKFVLELPGENVSQKIKGLIGTYRDQLEDKGQENKEDLVDVVKEAEAQENFQN